MTREDPSALHPPPTLSRGKRALLVAVIALGCLGFVEAGASLVYYMFVPESARVSVETALGLGDAGPTRVMRFRPHPYLGYTANPAYVTAAGRRLHEEPGIRAQDASLGARRPGSLRIVVLGGSTTFGLNYEDPRQVWPAMLEAQLQKRVSPEIEGRERRRAVVHDLRAARRGEHVAPRVEA